jgi:uncharacterized protein (DUF983 family)
MKNIQNNPKLLINIINEKCPKCAQGFVFKRKLSFMQLPVMNVKCEQCNYTFDREPGYFLGAMYVSYGLSVLQGIAAFLLISFLIPSLALYIKSLLVITVILLCGRKNYKISRVIYIHIFPW